MLSRQTWLLQALFECCLTEGSPHQQGRRGLRKVHTRRNGIIFQSWAGHNWRKTSCTTTAIGIVKRKPETLPHVTQRMCSRPLLWILKAPVNYNQMQFIQKLTCIIIIIGDATLTCCCLVQSKVSESVYWISAAARHRGRSQYQLLQRMSW